jgi:hypothetical protein
MTLTPTILAPANTGLKDRGELFGLFETAHLPGGLTAIGAISAHGINNGIALHDCMLRVL